ncbi:MAG: hypothetical protein ACKOE2_10065, partial [Actinomycetales bacterium]
MTESFPPLPDDPEQLRDLLRELGAKHPEEARKVAEKLQLRAWRQRADVLRFAATIDQEAGGVLRFDRVPPSELRTLLSDAPQEIVDQASDEGPSTSKLVELAEQHGALLGGFLSNEERDDVVFFADTLVPPPG